MGRPRDPEYWKKWRAAHPEYRRREVARSAARKKTIGRGDRSAEYARRNAIRNAARATYEPIPELHTGHDLYEQARLIVSRVARPDGRTTVYDPMYEDLMSVAVMALLEGRSALEAVLAAKSTERQWQARHVTGEPQYEWQSR